MENKDTGLRTSGLSLSPKTGEDQCPSSKTASPGE